MGDDGAGPFVISLLQSRYRLPRIECVTLDTPGYALLTYIQNKEKVILVDAAQFDAPPGTVVRITPDEVRQRDKPGLNLHDTDPFTIMDYAAQLV